VWQDRSRPDSDDISSTATLTFSGCERLHQAAAVACPVLHANHYYYYVPEDMVHKKQLQIFRNQKHAAFDSPMLSA